MNNKLNIIGLAGGGLIAIGCFLPWVSVLGFGVSGTESSTGWLFLVVGLVIGVCYFMNKRWSNITGVVLSLLTVAWAIKQITDVGGLEGASIGFGLWVMTIGAIAGLIGGVMAMRGAQSSEAAA